MRLKGYKDRTKWFNTKKEQQRRYYRKFAYAPNHGVIWSEEEKKLVLEHQIPDSQLSKKIGRSVGAIQQMRYILKKRQSKALRIHFVFAVLF